MSKLKVGDRVKVYHRIPFKGTITAIRGDMISVNEDGFYSTHNDAPFHFKQCRKLGPKTKPREWDLIITQGGNVRGGGPVGAAVSCFQPDQIVRVREVRTK